MRQKKRQALFPFQKQVKLNHRIIERLLGPRPRGRTLQQMLDSWVGGPDPREEWDRRRRELELDLAHCRHRELPPELPTVPEQVEEMLEEIRQRDPEWHWASTDEAVIALLYSNLELEPETRRYIAEELNNPPLPYSPNPERDLREAVMSINRIKDFLCKNGLAAGEADQFIAEALGLSSAGNLRQRLQRAK
jgi:hypothetical protein